MITFIFGHTFFVFDSTLSAYILKADSLSQATGFVIVSLSAFRPMASQIIQNVKS
jgi:hypothetical protein